MQRTRMFAGRSDRLVARLKCMLYTWRFMAQAGGQAFILWPNLPSRYADENVGFSPFQIFDLVNFYSAGGSDRIQFLDCQSSLPANGVRLDSSEFLEQAKVGFDRSTFAKLGDLFCCTKSPQYRFSDEPASDDYMISGVRQLFDELPVHPLIIRAKENFFRRVGLESKEYVAIHVRRGDVFEMLKSELPMLRDGTLTPDRLDILIKHFVVRTAPFEFYEQAVLDAISQDRKVVFTSDSPEIIRNFRLAYGRDRFIDLSSLRMVVPIQKAFLDFLILRDARHIVGTSSNFSQLPADLGGIQNENVAGLGGVETIVQTFHDAILMNSGLGNEQDSSVLELVRASYLAFQHSRLASIRARSRPQPTEGAVG